MRKKYFGLGKLVTIFFLASPTGLRIRIYSQRIRIFFWKKCKYRTFSSYKYYITLKPDPKIAKQGSPDPTDQDPQPCVGNF